MHHVVFLKKLTLKTNSHSADVFHFLQNGINLN